MSRDDNKGDFAILAATVALIREFAPDSSLTVVSAEIASGPNIPESDIRLTRGLSVSLIGTPVPSRGMHAGGVMTWLWRLVRAELSLLAIRFLGTRGIGLVAARDRPFFRTFLESDRVFAKGGSYLYSQGTARDNLYLWRMMYILRAAIAAGSPATPMGVSLGPFRPHWTRWFVRRVLRRSPKLYLREYRSAQLASRELAIPPPSTDVIPDVAFTLGAPSRNAPSGRTAIGFTVRRLPLAGSLEATDPAQQRYERAIAEGGRLFLEAHPDFDALFVPQSTEDVAVARSIQSLDRTGRMTVLAEDLSLEELLRVYGSLALLVGTRLHSTILAMVSGTPVINLACEPHKALGTMERLGLADWTLQAGELTGAGLAAVMDRAMLSRQALSEHIADQLPMLRGEIRSAFKAALSELD